jgi:hypothetical protein
MVLNYVPILLRIPRGELEKLDAVCKEKNLNRTEGLRVSYRNFMYNPDIVSGIVKLEDGSREGAPIMENLTTLSQDVKEIKEGINHLAEGNKITPFKAKERIAELIQTILQENRENDTTRDKLRDEIRRREPSLEQFMFPSASSAFSVYEQVLVELQENETLVIEIDGRIKNKGD